MTDHRLIEALEAVARRHLGEDGYGEIWLSHDEPQRLQLGVVATPDGVMAGEALAKAHAAIADAGVTGEVDGIGFKTPTARPFKAMCRLTRICAPLAGPTA